MYETRYDRDYGRMSDEDRYKYMHGGMFGDRDLYLAREKKHGWKDEDYEKEKVYDEWQRKKLKKAMKKQKKLAKKGKLEGKMYKTEYYVSPGKMYAGDLAGSERRFKPEHHEHERRWEMDKDWDEERYSRRKSPREGRRHEHHEREFYEGPHGTDFSREFRREYAKMHGCEFKRDSKGMKKWKAICDMGETDKYWLVRAELPGVRKEKLKVEIEGKDLIITGKRKKEFWSHDKLHKHHKEGSMGEKEKKEEGSMGEKGKESMKKEGEKEGHMAEKKMEECHIKWWKKERGMKGTFKRKIHLPKKVDHIAIEALYKDGVLEVLIKKPDHKKKEHKQMEGKTIPVH